jgi:glycosyltransferase involved in cell wall biosynthesis
VVDRSLSALGLDLLHVPAQFLLHHWHHVRIPCVVTVLDLIPIVGYTHGDRRRRARARRRARRIRQICRNAAGIVAISEATRADCVRVLGLPRERVTVIPPGVDGRFSCDAGDDAAVAAKHGLTAPFVLYVGAQDGHKNLATLVEAVRRLRARVPDVGLAVAGRLSENRRDRLPGEHEPWVRYTGFVPDDDLPSLYRRARVFATLSTSEGFCLPAAEAMACGVPVVASNSSALPETVGDAALTVDPTDADAAADALAKAVCDADIAQSLRWRGLDRAKRFRWDAAGRAYLDVFRDAVGGSR